MDNNIEQYKKSLIKLWKQCCENNKTKINYTESMFDIEKIVKYNVKDNYLNSLINSVFPQKIQTIWDSVDFIKTCYYFNVDKKKLSIAKLQVDVELPTIIEFIKKTKILFSSNLKESIEKRDLYNTSIDEISKCFYNDDNKIVYPNRKYAYYSQHKTKLQVTIPILSYNNVVIPISFEEFEELRCYELDCRKKDDMIDVYRNSTLLTPKEYKEFLMWKESSIDYKDKIDDSTTDIKQLEIPTTKLLEK